MRQLFLVCLSSMLLAIAPLQAETPKREFRATWFTTHYAIDWPHTKAGSASNTSQQQKEMTGIFDKLQRGNMNAVCFQARPVADAYYRSSYEPWGINLTGVRGKDPGYDPLAYAVQEAHKRGMELHAWVNPFRYEVKAGERTTAIGNGTGTADSDPIRTQHPDWLLTYNNGTFSGTILDPGNPEARAYVVKVLMEIVNNYDIDGILMDDYFYAYGGTTTEDAASMAAWKPAGKDAGDWRRENVNTVIKTLYDSIQAVKPWVKLGMGPGGIYSMESRAAAAYGLTLPQGIRGGDPWASLYCDPLAWVNGGYVDYLAPQIYWATTTTTTDYDVLCQWWGESVKALCDRHTDGKRTLLFISQASYRFGADELGMQIDDNRRYAPYNAPGSVFYNTTTYLSLDGEASYATLANTHFTHPALPPAADWKPTEELAAPTGLTRNGTTLSWKHDKAIRFAVYAWPKGMNRGKAMATGEYLQGLVYDKTFTLTGAVNPDNLTFAVSALDRYGNEYAPALLGEVEEKPLYVLTVTADDPDKGSVSGTGEYMEGTTVSLSAIPRYGYTFTRWQDGDESNPRQVTVTANATYTASFALISGEAPAEGTLNRTLLWQKSREESGCLSEGVANRSIAYYNDCLYIADGTDYAYHILRARDGDWVSTVDLPEQYFTWHNLRITEDGTMLLGNSATSANSVNLWTTPIGSGKTVSIGSFNNSDFGRTDYLYPAGLFSESGFLIALSNVNNKCLYIPFEHNATGTSRVIAHADLPKGTSAKAIPADAESFFASTAGHPATRHSLKDGSLLDSWTGSVKPTAVNVSGAASIGLAGHTYLLLPADIYGAFDTYDITEGMHRATRPMETTVSLGSNTNQTYTVDFATAITADTALVFLLAPNNGIAAWRYTFQRTVSSQPTLSGDVSIQPTADGFRAIFSGRQTVSVFSPAGMLLLRTDANDIYEASLPRGVWIVQAAGQSTRIMRP